jgi:hypothetical protein
MSGIWKNVKEELPQVGTRVKIDGRNVDAFGKGFARAVYTGVTQNGLSGFRSEDRITDVGVTDWIEVNMEYEDEEDWEWTAKLNIPDMQKTQTT